MKVKTPKGQRRPERYDNEKIPLELQQLDMQIPNSPGTFDWEVTCRRRVTPGTFVVTVRAADEQSAKKKASTEFGLGWIPVKAVRKETRHGG